MSGVFFPGRGQRGLVSAGAQLFPVIWQQVVKACLFPEESDGLGRKQLIQIWEWSNASCCGCMSYISCIRRRC